MKRRILNDERVLAAAAKVAVEDSFEAVTLSNVAKKN